MDHPLRTLLSELFLEPFLGRFKRPTERRSSPTTEWRKITMKNIYIGNLDYSTTEDQLRTLFLAHGPVETVTIVRDRDTGQPRGFAFLEMSNDGEAEKAIHALNGTLLGGRTLNVNEARSKPSRSGSDNLRKREHRINRF
jgi:RNA recognition motif-containing protein